MFFATKVLGMDINKPINIVCLKWGDKYPAHYVNKLYMGIAKNTTLSFKMHCFTDNHSKLSSNINIHKLQYHNIETWWNKLYLFSNELPFEKGEKLFYIDLDTIIVKNINNILSYIPKNIIVLRDFYTGLAKTVIGNDNIGSGLMAWKHGDYDHIWSDFIKNPKRAIESVKPHGDQKWIQQCVTNREYWQDVFPEQVSSFKVHCNNGLPSKTKIICYHGKPSIPDSYSKRNKVWKYDIPPQKWVKTYWSET